MVRRIQKEGSMRRTAAAVVTATAAVAFMLWVAVWYTAIPIIERSVITRECVDVDDLDHRYTCQTVPDWPTLTRWVP